jgi:hypothetical protein
MLYDDDHGTPPNFFDSIEHIIAENNHAIPLLDDKPYNLHIVPLKSFPKSAAILNILCIIS